MREEPRTRADYRHFAALDTRWSDNDVYGHVNNATYYAYFDSVINRYLISEGGLDIHGGDVIGLAVATACAYHGSVQFPDVLDAGLRVAHLGASSVRYEVSIFAAGDDTARADGAFTHVFVDRTSRRPVPIPERLRVALTRIRTEETGS